MSVGCFGRSSHFLRSTFACRHTYIGELGTHVLTFDCYFIRQFYSLLNYISVHDRYCKYRTWDFGVEGKYNPPRVVFSREPKIEVLYFCMIPRGLCVFLQHSIICTVFSGKIQLCIFMTLYNVFKAIGILWVVSLLILTWVAIYQVKYSKISLY